MNDVKCKVVRRMLLLGAVVFAVRSVLTRFSADPETPSTHALWPPLEGGKDPAPPSSDEPTLEALVSTSEVNATRAGSLGSAPAIDGECPSTHPVKGKMSSGIYHLPDGRSYSRTNADRCYADPEAAEKDGLRQAKA